MVKTFEGRMRVGRHVRVALVVSRFNGFVTEPLLAGALATLSEQGIGEDSVSVHWVPGAFEIPVVAARIARSEKADSIICLGALIRGETPHFEYISSEVTRGLGSLAIEFDLPIAYGILTCDDVPQARARSGDDAGNKGREAAATAIQMMDLFRSMDGRD